MTPPLAAADGPAALFLGGNVVEPGFIAYFTAEFGDASAQVWDDFLQGVAADMRVGIEQNIHRCAGADQFGLLADEMGQRAESFQHGFDQRARPERIGDARPFVQDHVSGRHSRLRTRTAPEG